MSFFDFLFRKGNPSNQWSRHPNLKLNFQLNPPSLNGVEFGKSFDDVSFLGRSSNNQLGMLCFHDLGIEAGYSKDHRFDGYMIVVNDPKDKEFEPFKEKIYWGNVELDFRNMTIEDVQSVLGEYYWLDIAEDEKIAFFEYPKYEIQMELTLDGIIKRVIVLTNPLMAKPEQRKSYGVDKPWPPQWK